MAGGICVGTHGAVPRTEDVCLYQPLPSPAVDVEKARKLVQATVGIFHDQVNYHSLDGIPHTESRRGIPSYTGWETKVGSEAPAAV